MRDLSILAWAVNLEADRYAEPLMPTSSCLIGRLTHQNSYANWSGATAFRTVH